MTTPTLLHRLLWLTGVEAFADEDERTRAVVVGLGMPLAALTTFIAWLTYLARGSRLDQVTAAAVFSCQLLIVAAWVRWRSFALVTHLLSAALLLLFGANALLLSDWSYLVILCVVPLAANYLSESRIGALWSVITIATTATLSAVMAGSGPAESVAQQLRFAVLVPVVSLVATIFHRGRERTLKRLADARARAEAANAARGRFMAAVSHELRTPLNGILGTVELARLDAGVPEGHREHLEVIRESGRNLVALINDLLDLSRAEAGRLELTPRAFSVSDLVRRVASLHRASAQAKGVRLEAEVGGGGPGQLEGDAARLEQVLHNLVGNAVKFTDAGAVTLSALVDVLESGRVRLTFRVRDTGRGLTAEEQARLFVPFGQARPGDAAHGTGLGLSISQALLTQMGGSLRLDSTAGHGSTFTVQVELAAAPATVSSQAPPPVVAESRLGRVLVVDDNAVNRRVAAGLLALMGHAVEESLDGAQALEALSQGPFDLVLMDLQMPVLDGAKATRSLRAQPGPNQRTPVVALTASAMPEELAACIEAGMDETLTKPLDPLRLRQVLARFLPPVTPGPAPLG